MKRVYLPILLLLVAAVASAQQLPALSNNAPVGPRDVLEIRVIEDTSMNGRVTVSSEGQIILNVVGKLDVGGLTPPQIEARLKQVLEEKFLSKATVSVQVTEYGNKPISVIGAVQTPGRLPTTGTITLVQAVTQAGGLTEQAGGELYVLRSANNGLTEQLPINVHELMVSGNPDLNIPLAPGDVVNVPVDTPISIYVGGEVMRPAMVTFRRSQTPTLLQALFSAGGPTDRAGKNVTLKRKVNGKEQTTHYNYQRILEGRQPDIDLLDGDIVHIGEAFF
ncbi:MAG TPA: polysaccharide biosynthesis/export family protein [Thermoanaerobaculia bacterium]